MCMSSSFFWNNEDFNKVILANETYSGGSKFYLDSGDSGPNEDGKNETIRVYNHLKSIVTEPTGIEYFLD